MEVRHRRASPCFAKDPDLPLALDQIARRYGTTPHDVLTWSPFNVGLAMVCIRKADALAHQRAQQVDHPLGVIPVYNLAM